MDLTTYFAPLSARFPSSEDGQIEIGEEDLPAPCPDLESAGTWWEHFVHWFNEAPIEAVHLHADRENARALGLLLLARLLRPTPERQLIRLTADPSRFAELVLVSPETRRGLDAPILSVTYEPDELKRFPLSRVAYSFDWPAIVLTCDEAGRSEPEILLRRRRVEISGTERAYLDLARVFLDAGREGNEGNEFDLEVFDRGNGGVRVGSCALKVWLPGSIGYLPPEERSPHPATAHEELLG